MAQKVFLRDATGLVREFGILDTIWINLALVGVFFSLTYVASTAPLIGGDPLTGGLIALLGMFFVGLAFSIVSIITPRTAGDYVFTSRYFHPAIGFVGNAGYFVSTVPLFIGITITTLESFGLSALFAYLGLATNNPAYTSLATTLGQPYYTLTVGGGLTVVAGLLPLFGYRIFKLLSKIILPLILIGVAAMFIVLGTTPQSVALDRLNTLAGNATLVQSVNSWGAVNNSPVPAAASWANTLALNAVYVVGFSYIISAIYVAGEVRQVRKSMPVAILATLFITFIVFAGATILSYQAFGYNFLSNLYVLSINYVAPPFAVIPYLDFLTAAISNNVALGTFIIVVATIQLWWYQANAVFVGGRLFLSYSMDRILPAEFGEVSAKFRAPIKPMIASLIIGLFAGVLFVLPTTAGDAFLMSGAAVAIIILFPIVVVGLALLVFRFKHKAEYNASPISKSFLGGPIYLLTAVVTVLYSLYTFYQYITVPAIFGFAGNLGLEFIFGPIVILFVIYYASYFINKSRGVDFAHIFKQIPPE
ncbi:MAG TPA: amino acid permease [Candidatus Dormibacteraeota bacterium]|nr:amino acid permease [Candidatus Dormibacteraeota bacterium]